MINADMLTCDMDFGLLGIFGSSSRSKKENNGPRADMYEKRKENKKLKG
jgi:hypothetical protein